jgi:hypothetical protein
MENNYNDSELPNSSLLDDDFSEIFGIGKGKVKAKIKKAKAKVKSKVQKTKAKLKKVTTSIKNKVGNVGKKFRNNFRKVLRKGILFNINKNIHGTAVKLYPAIATPSELTQKKLRFRPAYVVKAKKVYADVLKKWLELGGTEADLKAAIVSGNSKKRFLKNPYKSFDGVSDSHDFYSYLSVEGEDEGVENEAEGTEEVPSEEEKQKGIRGFFAWLKGIFSKNGANENPFEAGTDDAKDFDDDLGADVNNLPSDSEANNDVFKEISDTASGDDAGGDTDEEAGDDTDDADGDKILGMPKGLAIGLGVALLAIGGYIAYKKFKK